MTLRIESAGFVGCTKPRTGLPVDLEDHEFVHRVLPNAELVEAQARHLAGLPAADLTVATVTVDMLGPGHHPDLPVTLPHTTDGHRPAGLLVPTAAAVNFRFYLTLATATATGERAAIAPQLNALLAAHRAARPAPPPPVTPQDAPTALLRPERVAAAAVVVAMTLAALTTGTIRPGRADPPYRGELDSSGSGATVDGPDGVGGPFPSPSASPTVPGSGSILRRRPCPCPGCSTWQARRGPEHQQPRPPDPHRIPGRPRSHPETRRRRPNGRTGPPAPPRPPLHRRPIQRGERLAGERGDEVVGPGSTFGDV